MSAQQKKYEFKIEQFKSEKELHKDIQQWSNHYSLDYFFKKISFKYIPHSMTKITKQFKTSILQYSILKRFPSLFIQTDASYLIGLSQKIKQEYNSLNFTTMMNNDAYFYYLCVFMTKLVVEYLSEAFIDIQIDRNLESEIYIILVYVMIGLQVTTRNYEINHKKVIKERKLNSFITAKSSFSMSKLESIDITNLEKVSTQKQRNRKKLKVQRQITKNFDRQQYSYVEQFKDTLKENLYVKILPKIPKKKIKARQFDYFSDQAEAQKQGDQKKFQFTREQPIVLRPSQQSILSHQTSTSYEYFMRKNKQTTNFMNKNTKISYRPQYIANYKPNNREQISQNKLSNLIKRQETSGLSNKKNWNTIINEIKCSIVPTNKLSHKASLQDIFNSHKISKAVSHRRSETDNLDNLQSICRQIKVQENQQFVTASLGFNTISTNPPEIVPSKQLQKKPKSLLNLLRKQKHAFSQTCEVRALISSYSVFNINGCSAGKKIVRIA